MGNFNNKSTSKIMVDDYYACYKYSSDKQLLLDIWLYFNNLFLLNVPIQQAQKIWENQLELAILYAINWLLTKPYLGAHPDYLKVSVPTLYEKLINVATHYQFKKLASYQRKYYQDPYY